MSNASGGILFIFILSLSLFFQGQFRINLSGTGFKVAEDTSWTSQGNYAVADIQKSQVPEIFHVFTCSYPGKTANFNCTVLEIFF